VARVAARAEIDGMRILQMSTFAERVGGTEVYMHALGDELARRGHAVGRFGTSAEREVDEPLERVVRRPRFDPSRLILDPDVTEALEAFIALARTPNFSRLMQEQVNGLLVSVPVLGTIRNLIKEENQRERGIILAELAEQSRLANVAEQIQQSPRRSAEGRRLLVKRWEDEQARLLRNTHSKRF